MDIFSSVKEINRLLSKGMLNIYLKVTIEKKVPCFLLSKNINFHKSETEFKRHGVKVGPAPRHPGAQDWNPPQSLKVGPGTPLKFKSGTPGPLLKFKSETPGPPTKFKSGTPSPFFN